MLYCGTTLKSEKEVFLTHVIYPTQASIVHSLISSPASSYYKEGREKKEVGGAVSHIGKEHVSFPLKSPNHAILHLTQA